MPDSNEGWETISTKPSAAKPSDGWETVATQPAKLEQPKAPLDGRKYENPIDNPMGASLGLLASILSPKDLKTPLDNAMGGVADTLLAGGTSLFTTSMAALHGATNMMIAAAAGVGAGESISDIFQEEFGKWSQHLGDNFNWQPRTETGARALEAMDVIVGRASKAASNAVYETASKDMLFKHIAPIMAALTEGAVTTAPLWAGGFAGGRRPPRADIKPRILTPDDGPAYIQQNYPETFKALAASDLGKIQFTMEGNVIDAATEAANKALGIDKADKNMPLAVKLRGVLAKSDITGEISDADRTRIVNSQMMKLQELEKIQNATIPKLGHQVMEPIIVTPDGRSMTVEELLGLDKKFSDGTLSDRVDQLGLSEYGVLQQRYSEYSRLKALADKTDSKADWQEANKAYNSLKRNFMQTFEVPIKLQARRQTTFERFMNFGGDISMNELIDMTKSKKMKSQSGMIQIDGIEDNLAAVKNLVRHSQIYWNSTTDKFKEHLAGTMVVDKTGAPIPVFHGTQTREMFTNWDASKQGLGVISFSFEPEFSNNWVGYGKRLLKMEGGLESIISRQGANVTPARIIPAFIKAENVFDFREIDHVEHLIESLPYVADSYARNEILDGDYVSIERSAKNIKNLGYDAFLTREMGALNIHVYDDSQIVPIFDPLKLQKGMIDIQGLEKALSKNPEKLAIAAAARPTVNEADYQKVTKVFEQAREAEAAANKLTWEKVVIATKGKTLDHNPEINARLLNYGGLEGRNAMRDYDLIQGASARSKMVFEKSSKPIYDDLNLKQEQALDNIIRARRIVELDRYKGPGKIKHESGLTGEQAANALATMRDKIGVEAFDRLYQKSEQYGQVFLDQLFQLRDEGLITEFSESAMREMYYSPTRYIETLDPEIVYYIKGKRVSVWESGIDFIKGGETDFAKMSSRQLLAEAIGRAQNRIAKNKANKSLYEFASAHPLNGIVKLPTEETISKFEYKSNGNLKTEVTAPKNYLRVDFRDEGFQTPMFIHEDFAGEWITRPKPMDPVLADVLRWTSGTAVVKTFATSYNPAFALTNIPRDLVHIWLATGEYSSHLPLAMIQMSRDLAAVSHDAIMRTGRYEDFIMEGGGMGFLTHQGRDLISLPKGLGEGMAPSGRLARQMEDVKTGLSYINETSEILTRLMLRERALKNGADSVSATHIARNYLDFSKGGTVAKGIDTFVPFFNAALQAYKTAWSRAKTHPAEFGTKVAWLGGTLASVALANMMVNEEMWKQIPTQDKINNLILGTGHYILDADGNKRYMYTTIRLDNTVAPLNAAMIALLEKDSYGKMPDDLMMKTLGSLSSIVPIGNVPIPTVSAIATYTANYNFWTDREIWNKQAGGNVSPEKEYQGLPGRPTPEGWKQFGGITGLSPVRSQAAFGAVVPDNFYTDLVGLSYKNMVVGENPYDASRTTEEMIAQSPAIRRIIKLTHPASSVMLEINAADQKQNDRTKIQHDKLNEMIFLERQGKLPGGVDAVKTWVSNQPPEDRENLHKRYLNTITIHKIMERYNASDNIPAKIWWVNIAHRPAQERAALFHERWISADSPDRRRMEAIAGQMPGFQSDEFTQAFKKELKRTGDEQR